MGAENVIDWLTGDDTITLSLTQEKYRNKIKRLAEQYPDEVDYIVNEDGSVFAHVPVRWLKISPPRKVEMTEERKRASIEALAAYRESKTHK